MKGDVVKIEESLVTVNRRKERRPREVALMLSVALALAWLGVIATPASAGKNDLVPVGGDPLAANRLVVKIKTGGNFTIDDVTAEYPVEVSSVLLASGGLYFVRATDPKVASDPKKLTELAKKIEHSSAVRYAEADLVTSLVDTRYHAWPKGDPTDAGEPADWTDQATSEDLDLPAAHAISTGAGVTVAVLDTGTDPTHPALSGRVAGGYDYIDDDNDPNEMAGQLDSNNNGIVDEAYGHGTFVAGLVSMVAPDASIMPMRVLDSDGSGSIFLVAQAIVDAVDHGAGVINVSMGTAQKLSSKVIEDAVKYAKDRNVMLVAAAGNDASNVRQYPAQDKDVLSVTSVDDADQLSIFACWGDWVDVAAPGDRVLGPVPGGRYAWWAGTSMATPQVAGQVALIRSQARLSLNGQRDAVTKSATKAKLLTKFGTVNIPKSLDLVLRGKVK